MNPHVMIMASAGSGKTHQLTMRYICLLRAGLKAGQADIASRILATTFTRAAAGEIIGRVLQTLAHGVLQSEKRENISKSIGGDPLAEQECGKMLLAVVSHLHRLRICTLDAFLVRATMAFAPELGFPSVWRLAEDSEDAELQLQAIDAIFEAHVTTEPPLQQMRTWLMMLRGGLLPRQVALALSAEFKNGYEMFLGGPIQAWEKIQPQHPLRSLKEMNPYIDSLHKNIERLAPQTRAGERNKNWVKALEDICQRARRDEWEALATKTLVARAAAGEEVIFSRAAASPALLMMLRPLVDQAEAVLVSKLRDQNLAIRDLLSHFHYEYQRLKETRGLYRFDDLPRKLTSGGVLDDCPAFYFRLDGQIDHILLDEFQDTSVAQWKLLEPLIAELMAGGQGRAPGERTLLCVGDVKQTLFAWRNAEPRLFAHLRAQWPHLGKDELFKSYRSSQVIIDLINNVFSSLPQNPVLRSPDGEKPYLLRAAAEWNGWFTRHSTEHIQRPGACRLWSCAAGADAQSLQINAIRLAADRTAALLKESPGQEVAILLRRKKHMARMIEELRRRGVAAAGQGGSTLLDDPAVCAAVALLHLVDHPSDSAALFYVLQSPLVRVAKLSGGRSEEVAAAGIAIRKSILDTGLSELLNGWLQEIAPDCDARNYRRFQQLVELAHGYAGSPADIAGFLQLVKTRRVEDASAVGVRVMTIHASKGRQFDTVILPDLDARFLSIPPALVSHRLSPIADYDVLSRAPSKGLLPFHEPLRELDHASKEQKFIEDICGLYVAMTRAKSILEMIVHPQSARKDGTLALPLSPAGILRGALLDNPAQIDGSKLLFEKTLNGGKVAVTPSDVWAAGRNPDVDSKAPVPVKVNVIPPKDGRRTRPMVSPSGLEGSGQVNLSYMLSFQNNRSRDRGILIHKWFEQIEWLEGTLPSDASLRKLAVAQEVNGRELDDALGVFRAWCAQPNTRRLLARHENVPSDPDVQVQIWRERSFAVPQQHPLTGDQVTVQGQLDRVVVQYRKGKAIHAEILDFKTDGVTAGAMLEERVEQYRPQIESYRQAVAALTGLPIDEVGATLLFLQLDAAVRVSRDRCDGLDARHFGLCRGTDGRPGESEV